MTEIQTRRGEHPSAHGARLRSMIAVCAVFVLGACSTPDRPSEPTQPAGLPTKVVPNEDPGAPQDPNISLSDTYAVAIAEVQQRNVSYVDSLVVNPADLTVGHTFDASTPLARYRYEVGYTPAGTQVAAQRYAPGDTADGGAVDDGINTALIGTATISTNAYGANVGAGWSEEVSLMSELRVQLGNTNNLPALVNGFAQGVGQSYLSIASPTALAASGVAMKSAEASIPPVPSGTTVSELSPGVVLETRTVNVASGKRTREAEYALVGAEWQLRRLQLRENTRQNGHPSYKELTMQVRGLRVRQNLAKNALRASQAKMAPGVDALTVEFADLPRVPATLVVPPDDPTPAPPPPPVSCQYQATRAITGTLRIGFQHGILSDACTWGPNYVQNFFQRASNVRAVRITETPAAEYYGTQAAVMNGQLQATQAGAWVMVAHSNGGIVSRKAHAMYGSSRIAGIISIDSPHAGASITQYNRQLALAGVTGLAAAQFGAATINTVQWLLGPTPWSLAGWGARVANYGPMAVFAAGGIGFTFLQANQNVFREMQPGPASAGGLNLPGQETFNIPRIAQFSETNRTWLSVRLACDFKKLDSNKCVKNMQSANRIGWAAAIVGTIAGLAGFGPGFAIGRQAAGMVLSAAAVDRMFKYLVDGLTQSDGVVSSFSQRSFPGAIRTTRNTGDPTHLRVTRDVATKSQVEQQLIQTFGARITGPPLP